MVLTRLKRKLALGLLFLVLLSSCKQDAPPGYPTSLLGHKTLPRPRDLPIVDIAFAPRGSLVLALDAEGGLYLFDAEKRFRIWEGPSASARKIQFLPDGHRVALGCQGGNIYIWDAIKHETIKVLTGHTQDVRGLVPLPDNQRLVSVGWPLMRGQGMEIKVWDTDSFQLLSSFSGNPKRSGPMAICDGGSKLCTLAESINGGAVEPTMEVIDLRKMETTSVSAPEFSAAAFFPEGERLAAARMKPAVLGIHKVPGLEELVSVSYKPRAYVPVLQISPNGKDMISSDINGNLTIWTAEPIAPVHSLPAPYGEVDVINNTAIDWHIGAIAFSSDGRLAAVAGGYRPASYDYRQTDIEHQPIIFLLDVRLGRVIATLKAF
jgi:WD40 repeat protein